MSQLIKLTFNESIQVGDDVYSEGYSVTLPADQVFGSHTRRQLAPFDFFGENLVEEIERGHYRLSKDIVIDLVGKSIRKRDQFYHTIPSLDAFGQLQVSIDSAGIFKVSQSNLAVQIANPILTPGGENKVTLAFFFEGTKVGVNSLDLTPVDDWSYELTVNAPLTPGYLSVPLVVTYEGINYTFSLGLSVSTPRYAITNLTPSLVTGKKGELRFSVAVEGGYPAVELKSATTDGGTIGDFYVVDATNGIWALELTPSGASSMNVKLVLDVKGWTINWATRVTVTSNAPDIGLTNGVLDINLTQLVRMKISLEGKPVTELTTKSLVASGSKSYNTYTKRLVKVDDNGTWQWSVYTNSTEGPLYFDIVITVGGVDHALPRQTIIVRKGG